MIKRLRVSLLIAVLLVGGADVLAAAPKQEAISSFVLGNQAYKKGDYDAAIADYETIINNGLESGELYYNLGNAYFKKGNLGKAIANYERALQLIPRDSDVNFNLRHARSLTQKRLLSEQSNFLVTMMDQHIAYYTTDEMVIILTVLVFLMGAILLLGWIFKWSPFIRVGLRCVLFVLIVLYAVGLVNKTLRQTGRAIVLSEVSANFEPNEAATSHFELPVGVPVTVISTRDGWVKVRRADRRLGWIPRSAVEIL